MIDVWKSHFHITISDVTKDMMMDAAKLIGAKCTTIDLHKDTDSQRDRMLTKYQKGNSPELMLKCVKLLEDNGFKVVRYKLEEMFKTIEELYDKYLTENNYGEVHLKVRVSDKLIKSNFFRMSSNCDDLDYIFYNSRVYSDDDKLNLKKAIQTLVDNGIEIISFHAERVVYDSNIKHDSWWL